jgi:hypothetical protein
LSDAFSFVSAIFFVAAVLPYVADITLGEAKPRKATWLVWMTGDWIILAGMFAKGTYNGLIIAACFGATAIFILSLLKGERGWTTRDKVCLSLSGVAILLWQYFGESNWGIGFSALSLAIAAWPTYVSAWHNPRNESAIGWILFVFSSFLGVCAIRQMTFADIVPPSVFLAIDLPMMYLLFLRPYLRYRRHQFI